MINYLVIDGKPSLDFGLVISGAGTFTSPQKRYEEVDIPGRNGKLLLNTDNFFENGQISYECFVYENAGRILPKYSHIDALDQRTLSDKLGALRAYLGSRNGYFRLEDTYHPEEYRLAYYAEPFDPEVGQGLDYANLTLKFVCKPQRFRKDGEIPKVFTTSGKIFNPTGFEAKPLIRAYGTGSFTIDGVTMKINSASGYTDIDCELMECYKGTTNCNGNVTLNKWAFPKLKSGESPVSLSGISKLEIKPRWWTI